ncbi:hypothetical protein [Streptomyces cremeus]|uniref:Uncharacterized protein n=1 Tax=Streptomyces cremeus TaxID=66881 RepID=A0ABV5PK25_STRCM
MTRPEAQLAEVAARRAALVRLHRTCVPFEYERILPLGYSSRHHATKDLVRPCRAPRRPATSDANVRST